MNMQFAGSFLPGSHSRSAVFPGNEASATGAGGQHVSQLQYKLQRELKDATCRMGGKTGR